MSVVAKRGETETPLFCADGARMREAMQQRDAIFMLEGFAPDAESRAMDAAILAGRVTIKQLGDELVAYAKQHKSLDGFIQSRPWA